MTSAGSGEHAVSPYASRSITDIRAEIYRVEALARETRATLEFYARLGGARFYCELMRRLLDSYQNAIADLEGELLSRGVKTRG